MDIENKENKKMYVFYVSEFHLEMILLPFVNKKIEEKEKIIINTEYDLEDTMKVLLNRMNLKEENKEKILGLNWNKKEKQEMYNKSNIITIGRQEYIDKINYEIKQENLNNIRMLDCYKFDDIKEEISDIANKYDGNFNTSSLNMQKN